MPIIYLYAARNIGAPSDYYSATNILTGTRAEEQNGWYTVETLHQNPIERDE